MKRASWRHLTVLIIILIVITTVAGNAEQEVKSEDAKAVLNYITKLSNDEIPGAIVGQECGHGSQISDPTPFLLSDNGLYNDLVNKLFTMTGKWVGMIGVDYEHDFIFTPANLSKCNKVLIDYWNRGGLVTIMWSPQSPWLNNASNIEVNNGSYRDTRITDNSKRVDLKELLDPSTEVSKVWRRKLDRIADALLELKNAGVVVLWRPMQEMNGFWFWWSAANSPRDYIDIYRDMYDYFTYTKKLDNLLWVFSPATSVPISKHLYPGDDYVDIIAPTVYNDSLSFPAYKQIASFGKPMGWGECGAGLHGGRYQNGTFDNRKYINKIRKNYPKIAYWVCWHNWIYADGKLAYHSISANKFASELMNDPDVITLDKIKWRK